MSRRREPIPPVAEGGERGNQIRVPWAQSERRVPGLVIRPLQAFLQMEAAGGILLLGAAAVALAWSSSPWSGSYDRIWETRL